MGDSLQLKGYVNVWHKRLGELLYHHEGPNIVTEGAYELVAQILGGGSVVLPSHIAVGSNGIFPDPSQTVLVVEEERVALSKAFVGRQTTYTATMGVGLGTDTILEAGIFDDATVGVMWARFLTGTIDFLAGDTLDVEWELTVGDIV